MKSTTKNKIAEAIKTARASAALEGVAESEYTREVSRKLISGELTILEAIRQTRARHGLPEILQP